MSMRTSISHEIFEKFKLTLVLGLMLHNFTGMMPFKTQLTSCQQEVQINTTKRVK